MARGKGFRVVVATDGSANGRAAVATAVAFPWPEGARVQGLVARTGIVGAEMPPSVWAALEENVDRVAAEARRVLRRRWPDAEVVVRDKPPVDAICAEARGAGAVVMGSRGHGALGRLLLGSVSRGVVRRGTCPVLVVKGRPGAVSHFVIGVDGSPNARRAAAFVAGLGRPRGGRVTLVRVVEPIRPGSLALMPAGVRSRLAGEAAALNAERARSAARELAAAAAPLERAGWAVRKVVRTGVPLDELLAAAARADVLVVGARGTGGVERLLIGSVAEGALSRSPVSVFLVR